MNEMSHRKKKESRDSNVKKKKPDKNARRATYNLRKMPKP